MATLKSQLTELEGRISTLENFTGLIVHPRRGLDPNGVRATMVPWGAYQ